MSSFLTGPQKKRKNRQKLLDLGHTTTASAIAEIKGKIPNFDLKSNYPKVNGAHPSLAELVRFARGQLSLAFDHERQEAGFQRKPRKEPRSCDCGGDPIKCSGTSWGVARL